MKNKYVRLQVVADTKWSYAGLLSLKPEFKYIKNDYFPSCSAQISICRLIN